MTRPLLPAAVLAVLAYCLLLLDIVAAAAPATLLANHPLSDTL